MDGRDDIFEDYMGDESRAKQEEHKDLPFMEITQLADSLIRKGGTVYFKFTCDHCGARQTFGEANTIYTEGTCEECGGVTTIRRWGFMLVISRKEGKDGRESNLQSGAEVGGGAPATGTDKPGSGE